MAYQAANFLQSATSSSDMTPSGTQWNATVLGATTYSAPIYIGDSDGISIFLKCPSTGSPSAAWTFEVSNDLSQGSERPDAALTNWTAIYVDDLLAGSAINTKAVSNATSVHVQLKDTFVRWIRVVYTKTSGNCTITGTFQKKGKPS